MLLERDIINDDEEDEDDEEDNEDEQSTPIFSVTMNSNSNKSSRLIQPFKKNYNTGNVTIYICYLYI